MTCIAVDNSQSVAYFNSHAHVERDDLYDDAEIYHYISTHTLTWSVTNTATQRKAVRAISTHTLTWSVTSADKR